MDYRIDLRKPNADKLTAVLLPFIAAAAVAERDQHDLQLVERFRYISSNRESEIARRHNL
ncbi:Lsr2 family protein [Rhodococcus globerulus]|nr:Lsr2 family protein [Rhodococcus globerulus]